MLARWNAWRWCRRTTTLQKPHSNLTLDDVCVSMFSRGSCSHTAPSPEQSPPRVPRAIRRRRSPRFVSTSLPPSPSSAQRPPTPRAIRRRRQHVASWPSPSPPISPPSSPLPVRTPRALRGRRSQLSQSSPSPALAPSPLFPRGDPLRTPKVIRQCRDELEQMEEKLDQLEDRIHKRLSSASAFAWTLFSPAVARRASLSPSSSGQARADMARRATDRWPTPVAATTPAGGGRRRPRGRAHQARLGEVECDTG